MIKVSNTFLDALRKNQLTGEVIIAPMDCTGAALTAQGGWLLAQYHKETGKAYRPNLPIALQSVESITYNGNLYILPYVMVNSFTDGYINPSEQAAQIKFVKETIDKVKEMGYTKCHLATWAIKSSRLNIAGDKKYIRMQDAIYVFQLGIGGNTDFTLCLDYSINYDLKYVSNQYGFEILNYTHPHDNALPPQLETNPVDENFQWSESEGDCRDELRAIEEQLCVVTPKPHIPNVNVPHGSVVDSMLNRHKVKNYGWGTTEEKGQQSASS